MNGKILAMVLLAMLPGLSFGQGTQDYHCTIGDLQRRVEILYEAGGAVPCEVHYYKDTEATGERQVLWRALNEAGYCERKAEEFVAKLEDMGWSCDQDAAQVQQPMSRQADESGADAEAQTGDDTDTLMPGEDTEPSDQP